MGIAIVAGVIVIAVTIYNRLQAGARPAPGDALPAFGEVALPAPAGSRIVAASAEGDRLIVIIDGDDGRYAAVIDLRRGTHLGDVRLGAAP